MFFSDKGWETYKPIYTEELYNLILYGNEDANVNIIEKLKQTNREVITLLLSLIGDSKNIGFIRFLIKWEAVEVKKVRYMINGALTKLKSV